MSDNGWKLIEATMAERSNSPAPDGVLAIGRWHKWTEYGGPSRHVRYVERDLREWWLTDYDPCRCQWSCCWGQSAEHNRFNCTATGLSFK